MSEFQFGHLLNVLQVAVVFLLMITILVAAHELGHYLFARLFRMGIHEFALGFGRPKLFTWHRKRTILDDGSEMETEFNVRAWPLGGFVRIRGMEPQEDGSERTVANGFYSRPAWQRFIVLLAGPVFSVVAGLLVLTPLFWANGIPTGEMSSKIASVQAGSVAERGGLRGGDVIRSLDGTQIQNGTEARAFVAANSGRPIRVEVSRAGAVVATQVTPKLEETPSPVVAPDGKPTGETRRQPRLGILFEPYREPASLPQAAGESVRVTSAAAKGIVDIFTKPREAKENVGGVVRIVGVTNEAVGSGTESTLFLAAMLSISIGFFNLLPVPPLDGGQMLIAILEMLRGGRRVSLKFQSALVSVGSILLLTLFVGVLILDVSRVIRSRNARPEPAPSSPANVPSSR